MPKLAIISAVLMVVAFALMWLLMHVYSGYLEEREKSLEGLEQGRPSPPEPGLEPAEPRVDRPRGSAVEVLRLQLPEGDSRAHGGGSLVLLLTGNDLLRGRPDPASPQVKVKALGLEAADRLILRALEIPEARGRGAWRLQVTTAAGARRHPVAEEAARGLLGSLEGGTPWQAGAVELVLEPQEAPEGAELLSWPFFGKDPRAFTGDGARVPLTKSMAQRLAATWSPGILFTTGGTEAGQESRTFRLLRFRWILEP